MYRWPAIGPKIVNGKPAYLYGDFQFALDFDRIIQLLSTELDYDETVPIRELLQNSVDACRYRVALEKTLGSGWNEKNVRIHFNYDSKCHKLTMEDNGIGMDKQIIQNNFLKVGNSYYSEDNPRYAQDISQFAENKVSFYPISRFGIGILSCFLLCNKMEVKTCRKNSSGLDVPLSLNINPDLKIYVMKELDPYEWSSSNDPGTIISFIVNKPINLEESLNQYAINLEFPILFTIDGKTTSIEAKGYSLECFPKLKEMLADSINKKIVECHEFDLSKSMIEGIRGKVSFVLPAWKGKILIPRFDIFDPLAYGLPKELFSDDISSYIGHIRSNWVCTSNEGIRVPEGLPIQLPFISFTVIDFFGKTRPELSLDRRRFRISKRRRVLTLEHRHWPFNDQRLPDILDEDFYDFLSSEFRKVISNKELDFYSPFWKNIWETPEEFQEFFLRDRKARDELMELPIHYRGEGMSLSYHDVRTRFETGISIVFQRIVKRDRFGNFSLSPAEYPLLAIRPRRMHYQETLPYFWTNLFEWSELTLVENGKYYYLRVKLKDQQKPIYKLLIEKIKTTILFAEYEGIQDEMLYSNNFAKALNLRHPITSLFVQCLEKANSLNEIQLIESFVRYLQQIVSLNRVPDTEPSFIEGLEKQGLISTQDVRMFKEGLHIRDFVSMDYLFQEPEPLSYRYLAS